MQVDLLQILSDTLLSYVLFCVLALVGRFFLQKTAIHLPGIDNRYGLAFYSVVFGLIISVCLYSIVMARGITVNILIIPLLIYLVRSSDRVRKADVKIPWMEILIVMVVCISSLHLFPESEYKQNDSLFYLRIAEALNRTGQENTFHHANLLSNLFHGTEPYHYFEIWCTAMAKRMSFSLYNGVLLQRFVVQGIFITAIILGLYNILALQVTKLRYWHKLFCWSLVFFMPDLITYFPALAKYFVSNIEGNLLERPNFRIIYIVLIAVITEGLSKNPRRRTIVFWSLLLAVISFKFTILILPALLMFGLFEVVYRKQKEGWLYVLTALAFAFLFGVFYFFTGVDQLSSAYESPLSSVTESFSRHWKFVLFSIAASIVYIVLIVAVFLVPFSFMRGKRIGLFAFLQKNVLLIITALIGVMAARILFIKDNAYQFLFAAHIIVFLLAWLIAVQLNLTAGRATWLLATMLFVSPAIIKLISFGNPPDVFKQNGKFVYGGKPYSEKYLNAVTAYLRKRGLSRGVYIGDNNFYHQLHYSRRNPNVYLLPVSYIVAKRVGTRQEFCISDSASIMTGVRNVVQSDYLQSAIDRSIFFQYRKRHPALGLDAARRQFIDEHSISFIIATAGVSTEFVDKQVVTTFIDPSTGERFLAFR